MNNHMLWQDKTNVADEIVEAIRKVTKNSSAQLHEPFFNGNEWENLKKCLDTGFVSSVGSYVNEFESKIAEYTGAKYAVAMINGTAALHLALLIAGVGSGDEVLVPSLSFVATANAVSYIKAIPHFVECSENNFGVDPFLLRAYLEKITFVKNGVCINRKTNRIIKVLMPMHVFGHPCDIVELKKIAREYKLTLIEDAAESLGSFYNGKHTGTFGEMGIISFNGNKTITTGGGGAIITNDRKIAQKAKYLSTTAKENHPFIFFHKEVGYNYRMPNLNAALGCAQIEKLPIILQMKKHLNLRYKNALSKVQHILFLDEETFPGSNFWLQTILLDKTHLRYQKPIIEKCIEAGYQVRPAWTPLHTLPMFLSSPAMDLNNTISFSNRIINLPSGAGLT